MSPGKPGALAVALLFLAGCDSLWGTYLEDNPRNCFRHPEVCQAGEYCEPQTRRCEAASSSDAGPPSDGAVLLDGGADGPPRTCGAGQWCPLSPSPQTNRLRKVWGFSVSDVWAVGAAGTILHWDGMKWSPVSGGATRELYGVWGSTIPAGDAMSQVVWAVGDAATILQWKDLKWSRQTAPAGTTILFDIWGHDATDLWTVGSGGKIAHWNGSSWAPPNSPPPMKDYFGIGGGSMEVWTVGAGGTIVHTPNPTWTTQDSMTTETLRSVWGCADDNAWAVGDKGTILRWNGMKWSPALPPGSINRVLYGVWGCTVNATWTVGEGGIILQWNGSGWSAVDSGTESTLYGVWGGAANDVWAVGEGGTMLRFHGR